MSKEEKEAWAKVHQIAEELAAETEPVLIHPDGWTLAEIWAMYPPAPAPIVESNRHG